MSAPPATSRPGPSDTSRAPRASTPDRTDGASAGEGSIPRGRLIVIFVGLVLGILMAALDQTIVATALPTIASDLNGFSQISWIVTTYLLAQTVTMPLYGRVGDLLGSKRAFQLAVVVFLVGSVLAGLAPSMGMLIAFRVVQGVGAGGLLIGAQTIMAEIVSARERGKYMSVMGPMIGVATVVGPLLGGFLTDQISWRWIFYVNVPIGVAALVVTALVLDLPRRERSGSRIDAKGAVLLAAAVTCLVLVLTWGGQRFAWGSPVVLGLIAAVVVLVPAWLWVEHRAEEPIMPLRMFRDPVFRINTPLAFLVGVAMFGAVSYLPTYLQLSLGASTTSSGLLMLPLMGGLMGAAIVTGQLMSRLGRYKVFPILGTTLAGAGLYLLSLLDETSSRTQSSLSMAVLGLGIGFIMPVLVLTVQNSVPAGDLGPATAGVNFFRQIGASFGTALIGSLFAGRLAADLAQNLPAGAADGLGGQAQGLTTEQLSALPAPVAHDVVVSYAEALTPLYAYLVPLLAIGLVLALILPEKPLDSARDGDDEAGADDGDRTRDRDRGDDGSATTGATGPEAGRDPGPTIRGTVRGADANGHGATLTLVATDDGRELDRTSTADDGSYRLHAPTAGTYLLVCVPRRGDAAAQQRSTASAVASGVPGPEARRVRVVSDDDTVVDLEPMATMR